MANHITYLFGAGASAQSMPIVSEINDQISLVSTTLFKAEKKNHYGNRILENGKEESPISLLARNPEAGLLLNPDEWIRKIRKHSKQYDNFQTIDTYAKYLILRQKENDQTELKQIVDLYFSIRHFANDFWSLTPIVERGEKPVSLEQYDTRYDSLMASLLQQGPSKSLHLPSNLSFLSWNYDLEAELSYSKFFHGIEASALERFKKIPEMLHINGHSTMPEDGIKSWESYRDQLKRDSGKTIRYAFEGGLQEGDRNRLTQIIKRTTHLVVIGYSFPTFNRNIDSMIVRGSNLQRIYIQDLDLDTAKITKEKLLSLTKENGKNSSNNIDESNVITMRSANQFYIPTEINDSLPKPKIPKRKGILPWKA